MQTFNLAEIPKKRSRGLFHATAVKLTKIVHPNTYVAFRLQANFIQINPALNQN